MKFNLKNRPEVIEGPVLTKENGAYDWLSTSIIQELKLIKFKEWFEGFEKQLQINLDAEKANHQTATEMPNCAEREELLSHSWGRIQILKQILGDEK